MRLELVGGRQGEDKVGDPHPGSGHEGGSGRGVEGGGEVNPGQTLTERLADAQRLLVGVRERLQALADQAAALRDRQIG